MVIGDELEGRDWRSRVAPNILYACMCIIKYFLKHVPVKLTRVNIQDSQYISGE